MPNWIIPEEARQRQQIANRLRELAVAVEGNGLVDAYVQKIAEVSEWQTNMDVDMAAFWISVVQMFFVYAMHRNPQADMVRVVRVAVQMLLTVNDTIENGSAHSGAAQTEEQP